MGLLHRLGIKPDRREADYLAGVACFRLAPQLAHRFDRLAQMTPAAFEIDAHDRRLFGKPSRAHSEHQPAARIHVERRNGLGGLDRIALGQQADARSEADARGRLCGDRERDERVGQMRVELGHLVGRARVVGRVGGRHHQVLGEPERLEAGALGRSRNSAGIAGFFGEERRDADFHDRPLANAGESAPHRKSRLRTASHNIAELTPAGKACRIARAMLSISFSRRAIAYRGRSKLENPASFGRRTEERADEGLHLQVELDDHVVGTRRQPEAGPNVVLDAVRELAPKHGEDVVLLVA